MIRITVERRYGTASVRSRVTASSIGRAVRLAGKGASVVFPIDPQVFFQVADAPEGVERLTGAGRTGRTA